MSNYKSYRVGEFVLVKDVELSRETSRKVRPDLMHDLTLDVFVKFIKQFNSYKNANPPKVGAWVFLNHKQNDKEVLGQITHLYTKDEQLWGDLLLTNPEGIAKFERGELTERSIEWKWSKDGSRAELDGIALLAGVRGQDSMGWKDLTPDYQENNADVEISVKTTQDCEYIEHSLEGCFKQTYIRTKEEIKMSLTPEDLKALGNLIDEKIESRMNAEPTEPVNHKAQKDLEESYRKKEIELTKTSYANTLAQKGYAFADIMKSFGRFGDNTLAMEVEFKRLLEKDDDEVEIVIEKEWRGPSKDKEIETQYAEYKATNNSKLTLNQYKECVSNIGFVASLKEVDGVIYEA